MSDHTAPGPDELAVRARLAAALGHNTAPRDTEPADTRDTGARRPWWRRARRRPETTPDTSTDTAVDSAEPDQDPADPGPDPRPDTADRDPRVRRLRADWWRLASPDTDPDPSEATPDSIPETPDRGPDMRKDSPDAPDDPDPADVDDHDDHDDHEAAVDEDQDDEPAAGPLQPRRRGLDWNPPPAPNVRQSAAEWWRGFSVANEFLLLNGSAVAAGTWGAGLFTGDWSTGIPQLTLTAMHDAAAESTSTSTPLILGGLIVLGSAIAGAAAAGFALRVVGASPSLARFVHWALVRVPVASTITGLCLYTTP